MKAEELLLQLHDIETPATTAWWQVAPAILLLAGCLLMLLAAAWWYRRHRANSRLLAQAEFELNRIASELANRPDQRRFALALSQWLKQVALLAYPGQQVEAMSGRRWLEFLDRTLGGDEFTRGRGRIFGGKLYASDVDLDAPPLLALCQRWLLVLKPRLQSRARNRC